MNKGNILHFTKMQGLGNDYLYVFGEVPENIKELAVRLSDRQFGAGSDGMIYIWHSKIADFSMRIFNADGSEAKMCGNGIRCVGKYVYDKGYTKKTSLTIETLSGLRQIHLRVENEVVAAVTVEMGETWAAEPVKINDYVSCTPASTGNLHGVIFWNEVRQNMDTVSIESKKGDRHSDEPSDEEIYKLGKLVQKHESFSPETNVEFVLPIEPNKIRMRVFEAGSGITMACGTGATAAAMASVQKGLCFRNEDIRVILDGGELVIRIEDDNTALMSGPCETVYEGETKEEIIQ